jgi:AraC-like DNA-binding protein
MGQRSVVTLTTDAVPPRERFSYWRETMRRVACPLTVSASGGDLYGTLVAQPVAAVTILDSSASGHRLSRGRADIARGTVDSYFIFQQLGDAVSGFAAGGAETAAVRSGDVFLGDADEPFEAISTGFQQRRVWVVPRALVPLARPREAGLGRGLHLRADTPLARLLAAYLAELHRQAPHVGLAAAPPLAANVAGLIAAAAAGAAPAAAAEESRISLAAARLSLLKREVDRRLADPLLDPGRVAAACAVSPRTLHRAFESAGESFGDYLMRRRLAAARAQLAASAGRRSVTDIAFSLGFNSLATFYRGYHAAFGEAPGATMAAAAAAGEGRLSLGDGNGA